jgi:uncharacterized membrane protein YozB (DUF420 family)
MPIEHETVVSLNLILQIVLSIALVYALLLARRREFKRHCLALRLAFAAQILAILLLMSPAMGIVLEPGRPVSFLVTEILLHHALGLAVIPLFIYINLVYERRLSPRFSMRSAMQAAIAMWAASLFLGIHIYFYVNH